MNKIDISRCYNKIAKGNDTPILTPTATRLLRELLGLTPQALADLSSVKKNQLEAFEDGRGNGLSPRDLRWLQSTFVAAGADIFEAQGHLQVTLNGSPIIQNGEIAEPFATALTGEDIRDIRYESFMSQKELARISGISQGVISKIENRHKGRFNFGSVMRLICVLRAS